MQRIFSVLVFCFSTIMLSSQVTLVQDLTEGPDDTESPNRFNYIYNQDFDIALSESLTLVKIKTEETNWELFKITSNGIELVADIAPGNADSNISYMTLYKEKVYFIATDGTGHTIWVSDGTEAGTKMAFDLGTTNTSLGVNGFIVGRDDKLYFEFEGVIYSFDGENLVNFDHSEEINILREGNENSWNWCPYKDGIAVMDYSESLYNLLTIDDNGVQQLASIVEDQFAEPYGMAEFENGLIFSFAENGNPSDGMYSINTTSGEITKINDSPAFRVGAINEESCLAMIGSEYLIFNGDNPQGTVIHESSLNLEWGADWYTFTNGENILFHSTYGSFLDDTYSLYNSVTQEFNEVFVSSRFAFRPKQIDNIAFFGGTSINNINNYSIYSINLDDGILDELIRIEQPEAIGIYIEPISIVDGDLYFYADLESAIGQEIYKLTLEVSSHTELTVPETEFVLQNISDRKYTISHSQATDIRLGIYDASGRLVDTHYTATNLTFDLPSQGVYFIKVESTIGNHTFKVISK